MDTLKERLEKAFNLLKAKGLIHSQIDLSKAIGKTRSQVSDAFNERAGRLTTGFLTAIADTFPTVINKDYMITGEGAIEIDARDTRPHFSDIPAAAGYMAGTGQIPYGEPREYLPVIGDYSYSVQIRGDSMLPDIHSGDIAFCEILTHKNEVKIGEVYLVDTTEGAAVKVIANEDKNNLTLHSFNPDYPDYKVGKEDIIRIARVVAITRKY